MVLLSTCVWLESVNAAFPPVRLCRCNASAADVGCLSRRDASDSATESGGELSGASPRVARPKSLRKTSSSHGRRRPPQHRPAQSSLPPFQVACCTSFYANLCVLPSGVKSLQHARVRRLCVRLGLHRVWAQGARRRQPGRRTQPLLLAPHRQPHRPGWAPRSQKRPCREMQRRVRVRKRRPCRRRHRGGAQTPGS